MAHEWNIRPRGRLCAACAVLFADGQECVSALFDSESGYERSDFCLACWERHDKARTPFSLWQGAFSRPAEGTAKVEVVRRETAETLLRRLVALEDPANANVVYVLAVMLERKKQLIERDAKPHETGGIIRVYEHRQSGDTFVVLDPQLRLDEIGEVQRQVVALLAAPEPSPAAGGSGPNAADDVARATVTGGQPDFDLILRGGRVVDGTGAPARVADVGIRGGKIAVVGMIPSEATGGEIIDAAGCVVAPGFIDAHSHSDAYLLIEPDAASKVRQGVTTEVVGQCGCSAAPLLGEARHPSDWQALLSQAGLAAADAKRSPWRSMAAYREKLADQGHAPNVVVLAGHNTLRSGVMGYAGRPATADEVRAIAHRLERAMDEGASGFSTGLIYTPGRFSEPEEILALARAAASRGGLYATHMRSEGARLTEAVDEVLALVRATGIHAQISHLKTAGRANWHKLDSVLGAINAARAEGLGVHADRYPYCVSATSLDSKLPGWAQADGNAAILARLNDPKTAARIARELVAESQETTWSDTRIGSTVHPDLLRFRGCTVNEVARAWQCAPVEAYLQFLRMDALGTEAFFSSMSEDNLRRIYAEPWVMVGSDASIRATSGPLSNDHPHPRAYGAFARFLSLVVAGKLTLSLEEAIRRMTLLPAQALGLADRGKVEAGAWADIAVIDPAAVRDTATFAVPHRHAEGCRCTIVNGKVAFDGTASLNRPGRWLIGGSRPA
jgi:N-acyl-D-amino-acid deacylase